MSISFNTIQKQPVQLHDKSECAHCNMTQYSSHCVVNDSTTIATALFSGCKSFGRSCHTTQGWFGPVQHCKDINKTYDQVCKEGDKQNKCGSSSSGCCAKICNAYCK